MPHLENCTHLLRTKSAEFNSLSGSCCHAAAVSEAPRRISSLIHVKKLLNSGSDNGPTMWFKKKKRYPKRIHPAAVPSHFHMCFALSECKNTQKQVNKHFIQEEEVQNLFCFKEKLYSTFPSHSCNKLVFQFKTPSSTDRIAHLI